MKLDLVLENVRNIYGLGLLEENVSEKETLKGKILINEATMTVRQMLVENGLMEDTKVILENLMVKTLAGGGALYAGSRAIGHAINKKIDDGEAADLAGGHPIMNQITTLADNH